MNIIAIGEVLWDIFSKGKRLGGAPANFAFYCNELGQNAYLVSAVGDDDLGKELLQNIPICSELIAVNSKPTGRINVQLKNGIPTYSIHEKVAWDYMELNDSLKTQLSKSKAICFGSLAQRNAKSKKTIHRVLDKAPDGCLKVFDVNLRQNYYSKKALEESLKKTNLLKINDEELEILSTLFGISGSEIERAKTLMKTYGVESLALTKGTSGSYFLRGKEIDYQPIIKTIVKDTVGAGDAFLAGLVSGLLTGLSINAAHKQACKVSSFVCAQNGAMNPLKNIN
ncbi:carbohydrate kinase [Seonamhaeicola sp.]|uniref:carbohydrate kinase family protein n=1 Tax=Seonamhaeicola sp. TaxID=1912245 RepID=UPI0026050118|nr:carbohydrate kinase [Seonamhaeicola sp.]